MEDEREDALSVQRCMGHNKTHKTSLSQKAFLGHISTFVFTLQRLCQSRQDENKQICSVALFLAIVLVLMMGVSLKLCHCSRALNLKVKYKRRHCS